MLDDDRRDLQLGNELPYQLAGCRGLLGGHAGGGLVEQQKLGIIRQEKPDLQPLALTVREIAGEDARLVLESDQLQHAGDARACVLSPRGGEHRQLDVLEHRQIVEHARRLELAADPPLGAGGTGAG